MEPKDKTCQSWGNYDVNTKLFPDMAGWLERIHANGDGIIGNPLKVSFNVHPQTGVDHCDSRYPAFAARMGVDPATNATIPCDFGNKTFIDALYDICEQQSAASVPPPCCGHARRSPTCALFSTTRHSLHTDFDASPLEGIDVWWTDYGGCGGPDPRSLEERGGG
jgi:hypothetical protein